MFKTTVCLVILIASLALAPSVTANTSDVRNFPAHSNFDLFAPRSATLDIEIDYSAWDDALDWFVLSMGVSLREGASRRDPSVGTRVIRGHDSLYRMEANRIAFSMIENKQREAITEYRHDLERIGSEVALQNLSRNEQLAFWLNLHNVAMIEQLALAYPVSSPNRVEVHNQPLDEARFIKVNNVLLSLKDIRTQIVFRHWRDPRVIYGFFRGDIGGPSIQTKAFNAKNVSRMLDRSASEFINSLRGVGGGKTLRVSSIYTEAAPSFFSDWPNDLRSHLANYAERDVARLLERADNMKASIREPDIADLAKGDREADLSDIRENCYFNESGPVCLRRSVSVPLAVKRFIGERSKKIDKLIGEGKLGRVYVLFAENQTPDKEVE